MLFWPIAKKSELDRGTDLVVEGVWYAIDVVYRGGAATWLQQIAVASTATIFEIWGRGITRVALGELLMIQIGLHIVRICIDERVRGVDEDYYDYQGSKNAVAIIEVVGIWIFLVQLIVLGLGIHYDSPLCTKKLNDVEKKTDTITC